MNKNILTRIAIFYLSAFCMLSMVSSCNKSNPNRLQSAPGNQPADVAKKKVLYVIVDGGVGSEFQTIAPPILSSLVDHSIYTWAGLSGYEYGNVTNPSTWTTLLTGVTPTKHGVSGNDFAANQLASYPTIFTRLSVEDTSLRSVALLSSDSIKDNLAFDATVAKSFNGDDLNTTNAAIAELSSNDPDLLVVDYHSVDKAGINAGYSASNAAYVSAVNQFDTYLGQLMKAVTDRSNYSNENWLIIVTSNKGSNATYAPLSATWSAYDEKRYNTFTFYYNPRFNTQKLVKPIGILPYGGTTPSYNFSSTQTNNNGAYISASSLGSSMDFGSGSEFTMQCKVKIPATTTNYPSFLGKMKIFDNASAGFIFFLEDGNLMFSVTPSTNSGRQQCKGGTIADGSWHTVTGVVRIESGQRKIIAYTDGVRGASTNITMTNDYTSPADFVVGWRDGSNGAAITGALITDIRVYNAALSETYIAANSCSVDISTTTDTYYSNLVGFWPSLEILRDSVNGPNYLEDKSSYHRKMIVKNTSGTTFSETSNNICPPVSAAAYKSVLNGVDPVAMVFQWLNVYPKSSWGLDSKTWTPSYVDLVN